MADVSKLDALFYPKSVAVIGASTKPNTCGNDILKNLLDTFKGGPVYPINPKAPEILGVKAYQSVKDVPGDVDLAVIVVPSKFVLQTTQECADKGVKALVCISAGFKEVDAAGAELEKAFAEKVRENGMILVGPNCLGILNAEDDARMTPRSPRKPRKPGRSPSSASPARFAPPCSTSPKNATWASANSFLSVTKPTSTKSTF